MSMNALADTASLKLHATSRQPDQCERLEAGIDTAAALLRAATYAFSSSSAARKKAPNMSFRCVAKDMYLISNSLAISMHCSCSIVSSCNSLLHNSSFSARRCSMTLRTAHEGMQYGG